MLPHVSYGPWTEGCQGLAVCFFLHSDRQVLYMVKHNKLMMQPIYLFNDALILPKHNLKFHFQLTTYVYVYKAKFVGYPRVIWQKYFDQLHKLYKHNICRLSSCNRTKKYFDQVHKLYKHKICRLSSCNRATQQKRLDRF